MHNLPKNKNSTYLIVETGEIFSGIGYGAKISILGELVFNTSITGYQEVITDPSYKEQIVVFTYPHIGNIGTCELDNESHQVWPKAIITRELPTKASNWRSKKNFKEYLLENKLPGIAEIDTRKLTKKIRDCGNLIAMVVRDQLTPQDALKQILLYKNTKLKNSGQFSSNERIKTISGCYHNNGINNLNILVIDFGCKSSILKILEKLECKISVLNSDASFVEVKNTNPSGVVLSNGPGNPESYISAITLIKEIIKEKIPILGICLGHQLLGIALGGKIQKLHFGHHGTNHPVKDLVNNKVFITSQNHNYVITKTNLPSSILITHLSLFDNSIQGFMDKKHLFIGFQGHPEGGPGPTDIQNNIVERFIIAVKRGKHIFK